MKLDLPSTKGTFSTYVIGSY